MWGNCWGGGAPDSGKGRGQGKGRTDREGPPGGRNRHPGTLPYLKNHRKMLAHMTRVASEELSLAVYLKDEAERNYKDHPTFKNLSELREASERVKNQEWNVDWIAFKRACLDEHDVYILANEDVIHLTDEEKQWNREMRRA